MKNNAYFHTPPVTQFLKKRGNKKGV